MEVLDGHSDHTPAKTPAKVIATTPYRESIILYTSKVSANFQHLTKQGHCHFMQAGNDAIDTVG